MESLDVFLDALDELRLVLLDGAADLGADEQSVELGTPGSALETCSRSEGLRAWPYLGEDAEHSEGEEAKSAGIGPCLRRAQHSLVRVAGRSEAILGKAVKR